MFEQIESSPSTVMSGTAEEVARLLRQTREQRTVAVTFSDDEQGVAAEQVMRRVMEFLPQLIRERQQETLKNLTDVFLTSLAPRRQLVSKPVHAFRPKQRP
jgi:glutamine synthetase adenylyltransferase